MENTGESKTLAPVSSLFHQRVVRAACPHCAPLWLNINAITITPFRSDYSFWSTESGDNQSSREAASAALGLDHLRSKGRLLAQNRLQLQNQFQR